ncbi:uncharacterized protein LOC143230606 isoform X2 [Tachypleus tridentatus]|uniref:uncharacterized protein LOC143230606 isoform X2 n=1 Tax=Tachypleus tridentatus TaxID=6853 RepID=UPI003FD69D17
MEPFIIHLRIFVVGGIFLIIFCLYFLPVITLIFSCISVLLWIIVLFKRYQIRNKHRQAQLSLTLSKSQKRDINSRSLNPSFKVSPVVTEFSSDLKEVNNFIQNISNHSQIRLSKPRLRNKTNHFSSTNTNARATSEFNVITPAKSSLDQNLNLHPYESNPTIVGSGDCISLPSRIYKKPVLATSTKTCGNVSRYLCKLNKERGRSFKVSDFPVYTNVRDHSLSLASSQLPELEQREVINKRNVDNNSLHINCKRSRPENVISVVNQSSQTGENRLVLSVNTLQMPTAWLKHYSKTTNQSSGPKLAVVESKSKQVKRKFNKNVDSSYEKEYKTPKTSYFLERSPFETASKRRQIFLSAKKRYPLNQDLYDSVGLYPTVNFQKTERSTLSKKCPSNPVTVKITLPDVLKKSSSRWNFIYAKPPEKSPSSPCDAKVIVAALRESRKRSLKGRERSEFVEDMKRRRRDSNSSITGTVKEALVDIQTQNENTTTCHVQDETSSTKRPVTPDVNQLLTTKKRKNNSIFSSYSSSRHISQRNVNESSLTRKLEELSSPLKTTEPQISEGTAKETIPLFSTNVTKDEVEKREELKTCVPLHGSSKEGHTSRRQPAVYVNVSPSSTKVAPMPEHLHTLEEFERDSKIEEKRLQKLLSGIKSSFKATNTVQSTQMKTLDSSVELSTEHTTPLGLASTTSSLSLQTSTQSSFTTFKNGNTASVDIPKLEGDHSTRTLTTIPMFLCERDRKLLLSAPKPNSSISVSPSVVTSSSELAVGASNASSPSVASTDQPPSTLISVTSSFKTLSTNPTMVTSSFSGGRQFSSSVTSPTVTSSVAEFQLASSGPSKATPVKTSLAKELQFGSSEPHNVIPVKVTTSVSNQFCSSTSVSTKAIVTSTVGELQFGSVLPSDRTSVSTVGSLNVDPSVRSSTASVNTSSVGGFHFGSAVLTSFTPATTSCIEGFQFGSNLPSSTTPMATSSTGGFQFGSSVPSSTNPATTSSVGGFQFGPLPSSTNPATTSSVGGFQFGSLPSSTNPATTSSVGGFQFGSLPSSTNPATTSSVGGFQFGSLPSSTNPATTSSVGGFQFGSLPSSTTPGTTSSVGGFQFGSLPSTSTSIMTTSVGGFQFGSPVPSSFTPATASSVGGFQFGSTVPSSTTPVMTSSVGGFQFGSSVPSSFTPATVGSVGGFQFGSSIPSNFTPVTTSSGGFQFGSSAPSSFTSATESSVGGFKFNFESCSTAPSMQSPLEKNPSGGFKFSLASSTASSTNKEKGFSFTFGSSESGKPDTKTSQHVATGLSNPPSVFSPLITSSNENQKPSLFSSPQIFKETTVTPDSSTLQVKFGQNNQTPVQGIFSNLSTGGFSIGQGSLFQNSSGVHGSGSSGQNTAFGGANQNQNSFGSSSNKLETNFGFVQSPNQSLSFGHSNIQQSTPGSFQFGTGSGNAFQSPSGFSFSSVSQGANFNFSAKPNINFGGTPPLSAFGNPAPGSRPGTPQGGTLFSVGANSKTERRTTRRRPQRK